MEIEEYQNIYTQEKNYWWYKGLQQLVLHFVNEKFQQNKQKLNILDAGCGTGGLLLLLEQFGETEGIDFSDESIKFCHLNNLVNVSKADLNDWQAKENQYDIIISLDVLCQIEIKNDQHVIDKFYKSLKKDGVLILNLPAFEVLKRHHDDFVHSGRRYRTKQLCKLLENSGFQSTYVNYRLALLFILILIKKPFERKKEMQSDLHEIHPILNKLLFSYTKVNNFFFKKKLVLPFGSSVFSISKK